MRCMGATLSVTASLMRVFYRNPGSRRFDNVQWCAVSAEHFGGRPFREDRNVWWSMLCKFLASVNDLSTNDGENRFQAFDFCLCHREIIVRECNKVGQLPWSDSTFLAALARKPTAALCIKPQRLFAAEEIFVGIHRDAAERLAGHEPVQGDPR